MPEDSRIEELLDLWEDLHEEGESLTFEEFVARHCKDDGDETLTALKAKIAAIAYIDELLADNPLAESFAEVDTKGADQSSNTIEFKSGSEPVSEYRLVSSLGSGGFGEVWKASGPGGFHVALKFVRMDRTGGAAVSELRGLEIAKRIRHPNILSTFGTWQKDGWLVIAAELAGQTLYDRFQKLKENGEVGIPERELLAYMKDAAKAIDFLNKRKHRTPDGGKSPIQHRDIKPQNLLLSGGSVKVADLGIAKHVQRSVTGHTGTMTLAYAPPEAFNNETTDSYDQYSLAVTYCLLRGGRLPFSGTDLEIVRGHISGLPDLSMLPEAERPIVERALAKKPEDRWPSCSSFVSAIEDVPRFAPLILDTTPPTLSDDQQRQSQQKTRAFMAVLLLMMVVAGMAWYAGALTSETDPAHNNTNGKQASSNKTQQRVGALLGQDGTDDRNAKSAPVETKTKIRMIKRRAPKPTFPAPPEKQPIVRTPVVAPKPILKERLQPQIVVVRRLAGHTSQIRTVSIAPDGGSAISGGVNAQVFLWDLRAESPPRRLKGHTSTVNCVSFSPDSLVAASAAYDGTVRFWRVSDATKTHTIRPGGDVRAVAFAPRDLCVVGGRRKSRRGEYGFIQLWNTKRFRRIREFVTRFPVLAIDVSRSGRYIVAGEWGGTLEAWDLQSRRTIRIGRHKSTLNSVRISKDGQHVLSASMDGVLRLTELRSGREKLVRSINALGRADFLSTLDGTLFASARGELIVWDQTTGAEIGRIALESPMGNVAATPDGQFILAGGATTLQLLQVRRRQPTKK